MVVERSYQLESTLKFVSIRINNIARQHGFWPKDEIPNKAEKVALMHSELSELLEAIRDPGQGKQMSTKCPDITAEEEELADTVIRILDYCEEFDLRLGFAIIAKIQYNEGRPHKHGKEF